MLLHCCTALGSHHADATLLSDLLAFAPQPCSLFLISLMVISAFESVTILSLSGIILISERG